MPVHLLFLTSKKAALKNDECITQEKIMCSELGYHRAILIESSACGNSSKQVPSFKIGNGGSLQRIDVYGTIITSQTKAIYAGDRVTVDFIYHFRFFRTRQFL
mmetsp:Transcript_21924/g.33164  ORF Transcript_21924/g.33164 Transcript_21924/m.33164 type:complete len:103 (-) Transcript_21924:21-329(-)